MRFSGLIAICLFIFGTTSVTQASDFWENASLGTALGAGYTFSTQTRETAANGLGYLRFDGGPIFEIKHSMKIGAQPYFVAFGYGKFSRLGGVAEYKFREEIEQAHVTGSTIGMTQYALEFGVGPRYRLFPKAAITPFFEITGHTALAYITYDDPQMGQKISGSPFTRTHWSPRAGFAAAVGAALQTSSVGVEATFRRSFTRTFKTHTADDRFLSFFTTDATLALTLPF